jgi:hypothetical protein
MVTAEGSLWYLMLLHKNSCNVSKGIMNKAFGRCDYAHSRHLFIFIQYKSFSVV